MELSADGLTFLWLNKKGSKEISLRGKVRFAKSPLKNPPWGMDPPGVHALRGGKTGIAGAARPG